MVRISAFGWLAVMVAAPIVAWHRVLGSVLGSFHWSLSYFISEITPWLLLLAGIAFFVPVAVSAGQNPESRFFPRSRRALIGWGTVAYLLGLILAIQLSEVWAYAH